MKLRYAIWAVAPGIILLASMLRNPHVDDLYHLQRVQPFILMTIAKAVLIGVLILQHPGPDGVPGWQIWRWMDPLTICLIAMFAGSGLYYLMLWGGNSKMFRPSDGGYTLARMMMWIDGYAMLSVALELLYRGIKSRIHERRRRQERYDLQNF